MYYVEYVLNCILLASCMYSMHDNIIIIELVTVTIKTRSIVVNVTISLFPLISRGASLRPRFSVCGCREHFGALDGGVLGRSDQVIN